MKRSRAVYVALAAAGALALAACSGSSNDTTANTTSSSSAPTSAARTFTGEVKIGTISNSSAVSQMGNPQPEYAHATQAAVDAINAKGGLNGKKIVLDFCDEGGNPNKAADCARKLVSDGVVADVGDANTNGDKIGPILLAAGIPRIAPLALSATEYNSKGNYPLNGGAVVMFQGAAISAAQHGAKSIFIAATQRPKVRVRSSDSFQWSTRTMALPTRATSEFRPGRRTCPPT